MCQKTASCETDVEGNEINQLLIVHTHGHFVLHQNDTSMFFILPHSAHTFKVRTKPPDSVWMEDTILKNLILCMPEVIMNLLDLFYSFSTSYVELLVILSAQMEALLRSYMAKEIKIPTGSKMSMCVFSLDYLPYLCLHRCHRTCLWLQVYMYQHCEVYVQ